jgi:Zn-dependent peptidase ImmA (M78 family)
MHHRPGLHLWENSSWWANRNELQAHYAASLILIPPNELLDRSFAGQTAREIAAELQVTEDLVKIRTNSADVIEEARRRMLELAG